MWIIQVIGCYEQTTEWHQIIMQYTKPLSRVSAYKACQATDAPYDCSNSKPITIQKTWDSYDSENSHITTNHAILDKPSATSFDNPLSIIGWILEASIKFNLSLQVNAEQSSRWTEFLFIVVNTWGKIPTFLTIVLSLKLHYPLTQMSTCFIVTPTATKKQFWRALLHR